MIFDEWWNNWSVKDWNDIESAKNLFQQAFEAGLHADVHTDNSKVIADLEEKLANADYQLEGRDLKIKELEAQIERLEGDLELWESGACRTTNLDKCGVVTELESQIEKMKCCSNCDNWNWKHSKCEKKLKGDCFKQSKWILRR